MSEPDESDAGTLAARRGWYQRWRGITGSLALGLVALALVVGAVEVFERIRNDSVGPGATAIVWHGVAALGALGAQWVADRRQGPVAGAAGFVVAGIAAAVLWFFWYS